MSSEDYVDFKTSKSLKEKGFDGLVLSCYDEDGKIVHYSNENNEYKIRQNLFPRATISMVAKWLRETHNIIPLTLTGDNLYENYVYYWFRIDRIVNGKLKYNIYRDEENEYQKHENAEEAAIKYCLENLI